MSNASPQHPATRVRNYQAQNGTAKLTPAQDRRAAKTDKKNGK